MGIETDARFIELENFACNLPAENGKSVLEGAPFFSGFGQMDQKRIIGLFTAKAARGELEQLARDRVAGLEKNS